MQYVEGLSIDFPKKIFLENQDDGIREYRMYDIFYVDDIGNVITSMVRHITQHL
jgi:hypothetical protein